MSGVNRGPMGFSSTDVTTETTAPDTTTPEAASPEEMIPDADELQQYLADHTDHTTIELTQAVTALQDEFQFLTSVSAYYLLGQRLGVDLADAFETKQQAFSLDIANLQPEMNSVDLAAAVDQITAINTFSRDDGSDGKVCNIILKDETGKCVLTLWDDDTAYRSELEPGETVRIEGGYSKMASDYCQNRFNCSVEVRIGDGQLLRKQGEGWTPVSPN